MTIFEAIGINLSDPQVIICKMGTILLIFTSQGCLRIKEYLLWL